jgi:hypothetical protein
MCGDGAGEWRQRVHLLFASERRLYERVRASLVVDQLTSEGEHLPNQEEGIATKIICSNASFCLGLLNLKAPLQMVP